MITPTAPAVHHSPHLVTAKQLESEIVHAQSPRKVRSPDSDSNPVILARAGQKKYISRSVTPRRGITSWLAANCIASGQQAVSHA